MQNADALQPWTFTIMFNNKRPVTNKTVDQSVSQSAVIDDHQ